MVTLSLLLQEIRDVNACAGDAAIRRRHSALDDSEVDTILSQVKVGGRRRCGDCRAVRSVGVKMRRSRERLTVVSTNFVNETFSQRRLRSRDHFAGSTFSRVISPCHIFLLPSAPITDHIIIGLNNNNHTTTHNFTTMILNKIFISLSTLAFILCTQNAIGFTPSINTKTPSVNHSNQQVVSIPLDDLTSTQSIPISDRDAWIVNLDYPSFAREVTALGRSLQQNTGEEDVKHLNKIVEWRDLACGIGVATMWMDPNPLTVVALSTWTYASWTMIGECDINMM